VVAALGIGVVIWAAFDWIVTVLGMAARAQGLDVEPTYALLMVTVDALPVGLTGLFIAGVLAVAMSTVDAYLLIAGGNLAYDLYRPLFRPDMDDRSMLRLTRWMIALAALVSVLLALFFQSIVAAWIFMATMLISAAFVPLMAALYLPFRPRPAAGLASSLAGLLTALAAVLIVNAYGSFDEEWGTAIWHVTVHARELAIWQEYAVLAALPASAAGFALGQLFGRRPPPPRPASTDRRAQAGALPEDNSSPSTPEDLR
jgi:solute:Na+ symporter, SSS family